MKTLGLTRVLGGLAAMGLLAGCGGSGCGEDAPDPSADVAAAVHDGKVELLLRGEGGATVTEEGAAAVAVTLPATVRVAPDARVEIDVAAGPNAGAWVLRQSVIASRTVDLGDPQLADNAISVAGTRYLLGGDVKVRPWAGLDGKSLEELRAEYYARPAAEPTEPEVVEDGPSEERSGDAEAEVAADEPQRELSPYYLLRSEPDVPITVDSIERARASLDEEVNLIMLHTDLTYDASENLAVLARRGFSTHYAIDWDGTIITMVDPLYMAFHAGERNRDSVAIDLNNLMPNLERHPDAPPYPEGHPAKGVPEFARPISRMVRINGGHVRSYGYTDAQNHTLAHLVRALLDAFPNIPARFPTNENGQILVDAVEDPAGLRGIVAHWHTDPDRWDPGPAIDWWLLCEMLELLKVPMERCGE